MSNEPSALTRFALPIAGDFAESRPLTDTIGEFIKSVESIARVLEHLQNATKTAPAATVPPQSAADPAPHGGSTFVAPALVFVEAANARWRCAGARHRGGRSGGRDGCVASGTGMLPVSMLCLAAAAREEVDRQRRAPLAVRRLRQSAAHLQERAFGPVFPRRRSWQSTLEATRSGVATGSERPVVDGLPSGTLNGVDHALLILARIASHPGRATDIAFGVNILFSAWDGIYIALARTYHASQESDESLLSVVDADWRAVGDDLRGALASFGYPPDSSNAS